MLKDCDEVDLDHVDSSPPPSPDHVDFDIRIGYY
jgi:hypothetical protein